MPVCVCVCVCVCIGSIRDIDMAVLAAGWRGVIPPPASHRAIRYMSICAAAERPAGADVTWVDDALLEKPCNKLLCSVACGVRVIAVKTAGWFHA